MELCKSCFRGVSAANGSDHGVKLLGEGGVVVALEAAPAMRREAVRFPDALYHRHGEAGHLGHRARRPVRGLVRRRLQRHRDDLRGALDRIWPLAWRAGLVEGRQRPAP